MSDKFEKSFVHLHLRSLYRGREKHCNHVADGVNRIAYNYKLDQSQEKEPDFLFLLHFESCVQFSEDCDSKVMLN